MNTLQSISLSGANYARYSVTIKCKQNFENVFARPSYTTSISPNVSSQHHEDTG